MISPERRRAGRGAALCPRPPAIGVPRRTFAGRAIGAGGSAGGAEVAVEGTLLDVAATLRARAEEQAHLDAGETGDIDLAVELIEERPSDEQTEILEAMRRANPAKARLVQAALISDQSFERVTDECWWPPRWRCRPRARRVTCGRPPGRRERALAAVPRTVAAAIQEDLSLEVAPTPREMRGRTARDVRGRCARRCAIAGSRHRRWRLARTTKEPRARWWRYEVARGCLSSRAPCRGGDRRLHDRRAGRRRRRASQVRPIPVRPDALPPPKPLKASVLDVVNLQRSSANLADKYAESSRVRRLPAGPRAVEGRRTSGSSRPTPMGSDAPADRAACPERSPTDSLQVLVAGAGARGRRGRALDYEVACCRSLAPHWAISATTTCRRSSGLLASSGSFEGDSPQRSEAEAVIKFGQGLGGEALPPDTRTASIAPRCSTSRAICSSSSTCSRSSGAARRTARPAWLTDARPP